VAKDPPRVVLGPGEVRDYWPEPSADYSTFDAAMARDAIGAEAARQGRPPGRALEPMAAEIARLRAELRLLRWLAMAEILLLALILALLP
jgi:hypothetical protein